MAEISAPSSFRDRTEEFQSIVESLKMSLPSGFSPSGPSSSSSRSEFNTTVSQVRYKIDQTSQKLAKLVKFQEEEEEGGGVWCQCCLGFCRLGGEVPKRNSDFDDPTIVEIQIQELTSVISQDIAALKSAVVELHCKISTYSGNISTHGATHLFIVMDDLNNRLLSTEREFNKQVLIKQSENSKVPEDGSRKLFSSTAGSSNAPADSSFLLRLVPKKQVKEERQPLLQQPQQQQQQQPQQQPQQQHQLAPLQDSYRQSRAEALQKIESTINELSEIIIPLSTLVSQQGEIAIRIDENMDDTVANLEGADVALSAYLRNIPSDKWLMFKILLILIFFLMFFLKCVA